MSKPPKKPKKKGVGSKLTQKSTKKFANRPPKKSAQKAKDTATGKSATKSKEKSSDAPLDNFANEPNKKRTTREKSAHVKTAKGRKTSSTRWLKRQLNDPYVAKAHMDGYRGRAAYKLIEIDEKAKLLQPDMMVVDLGAAPGGWCQVAANRGCKVIGLDLLEIDPLPDVTMIQMDFNDEDAPERLIEAMNEMGQEKADIVLSDMAPNTIGHKNTDHLRIMHLVELAYYFAKDVLKEDGAFLAKTRQGGTSNDVLNMMKKDFKTVKHIKPPSSRKDSSECFVLAQGFRG